MICTKQNSRERSRLAIWEERSPTGGILFFQPGLTANVNDAQYTVSRNYWNLKKVKRNRRISVFSTLVFFLRELRLVQLATSIVFCQGFYPPPFCLHPFLSCRVIPTITMYMWPPLLGPDSRVSFALPPPTK